MAVTIQTRRDDSVDWTTANPVLALGEIGIETDTNKAKYGDGFTAWNDLDYWIIPDVDKPVEPGTADGQTLRWNLTDAGWEATSDLVVDDASNFKEVKKCKLDYQKLPQILMQSLKGPCR